MCDHCGCGQPDHHHHAEDGSATTIELQQDVLAHDKAHANALRRRLADLDARLVNVIGSPGCGKTALLVELIRKLEGRRRSIVIEGDLATTNDAERIGATGAPVHQVQTGTACHLSAHDVEHGLEHLPLQRGDLVLVENVGNLVCPSMFDVGETLRIVCLSVTEGTDKPQKYPVSFREANLAVITKIDLLPHVDFDLEASLGMIRDIHPDSTTIVTSAKDGAGMEELATQLLEMWS